ncbi:MAG: VirB8/TrbF family protein [Alphaproteobacteria bacterium]|nr:VirB8/TrbF family protein [Alphaproteobacteria bacterium]
MSDIKNDVTESIESGEYFRDAMRWYGTRYHSPISERALLIIITAFAFFITIMALIGLFVLMPLSDTKTMIVRVPNSFDKVARVEQLTENPAQDPNFVVMTWFANNFINVREAYDIEQQQANFKRVFVLSEPQVYDDYVMLYKSINSPTALYERHTTRSIDVIDIDIIDTEVVSPGGGNDSEMLQVSAKAKYVATEKGGAEERKSIWGADITFRFSKIHVDQVTGAITPMIFKVTGYNSKQLGLE